MQVSEIRKLEIRYQRYQYFGKKINLEKSQRYM